MTFCDVNVNHYWYALFWCWPIPTMHPSVWQTVCIT